ncbi:hypothetical protein [Bradymonas sediminis]|uniref:Uncharacterized protein n=1 Tax=Bradymonas sediminis TaxID=1548548 RepID=A0A2Z4FJ66_9DELT|nr:hypothetical protein [Bradymonas sediminis]AWV88718.1 hypothetical protein DN745_04955 [Bradymonas sediminis]TDP63589.1 hypothetical protein DFR33_11046 [Bradymonas sediminis]
MTEEDNIRLLESRHDIHALADPSVLTDDATYLSALSASRDELAEARADLVKKVAHNTLELSQTDTERARTQQLITDALEHYRYYRGRTHDALLNPPPGQPLNPGEANRRQRLFDRYYQSNSSDIARLGLDKQVEALEGILSAYQAEDELKVLGHLPQLEAAFRPAIESISNFHREAHQDLIATRALGQSRAAFDRAQSAHIRLLESLLTRMQREDDARHFIKRRDPAYAARRRARTSVSQEPEAALIESEVHIDSLVPV